MMEKMERGDSEDTRSVECWVYTDLFFTQMTALSIQLEMFGCSLYILLLCIIPSSLYINHITYSLTKENHLNLGTKLYINSYFVM